LSARRRRQRTSASVVAVAVQLHRHCVESTTYTAAPSAGTPLFDSLVFDGFIGKVARGFIWKQRGDARVALLRGWGSRAPGRWWACSGLDHAWSEGAEAMKRRMAQRGQWPRSSAFASFFAVASYLSLQISTICALSYLANNF